MSVPNRQELIDFVVFEARLLDEKRYDEWNALFTDDAFYWIPLEPDQLDPLNATSHMYEDKLLRDIRVERFKSPKAYAQMPASRSHHLLQTPTIEEFDPASNRYVTRTQFHYTESQGETIHMLVGTAFHHLANTPTGWRMTHKKIILLNSDQPLPGIQLFV